MGKSNNRSSKPKLSKYEAPKQRRISKELIENATYKDVKLLEKFLSDRGKIRSWKRVSSFALCNDKFL